MSEVTQPTQPARWLFQHASALDAARGEFQFLCYANENFHDCAHLRWRESKDTKTPFMPS